MEDFYITLQSDSSLEYFSKNTITDFYNQFSIPISLPLNQYQVALVECSYIPSGIIIKKNEKLGKHIETQVEYIATEDFFDVSTAIKSLNIPKTDFSIQENVIFVRSIEISKKSKRETKKHFKIVNTFNDITTKPAPAPTPAPAPATLTNQHVIKWEPRIASMLGYDEETKTYIHPIFSQASATNLFVYCNIVEKQRVGDSMVPLLRKMTNIGQGNKLITREFKHLQYVDLALCEFDYVRLYIKTEQGEPPAFELGNFTATLHFKPQQHVYYNTN
jgi:hypothetical protein